MVSRHWHDEALQRMQQRATQRQGTTCNTCPGPLTAACAASAHGQQAAIVGGFGRNLLVHDQRMLAIDRSLHIVGRHFGATGGAHKVGFRFSVLLQFLQGFGDLARLDHHFLVRRF